MSAVTRMPLTILVVWVAMVQSECITNPMDAINKRAKEQYQTTDEYLKDMETSTPHKYQNLLRVYGIYRACVESGTKRWTDNVDNSCPYCRTKIEDEDKTIRTRPKLPDVWNSTSCAAVKLCNESQEGCFYFGVQASDEKCRTLGVGGRGRDEYYCRSDGLGGDYKCHSCSMKRVRTHYCPIMCGYCRPRCDFFCKNYGVLDPDLCKCECRAPYTGKQCEVVDCSLQESYDKICSNVSKEECDIFGRGSVCPKLCGLC